MNSMNSMNTETPQFSLTADEREQWEENGYFVRFDVFTEEENAPLAQIADDIVDRKRVFPEYHIFENALVRDGKAEAEGIYAIHNIQYVSCYCTEFLERTRDRRLTDPVVDLLGPDILGLNNLYIWKPPRLGLGFPWHQDKWYFNHQFKTDMTVATWSAIDNSDKGNGCLYVIPGSHKHGVRDHEELEGTQQGEFRQAQGARDEDGVAVEVPAGAVIWFNSKVLHKSTDNHSDRFRRCNVAHYISAKAEWTRPEAVNKKRPPMWIRGKTFPGKLDEIEHHVIPTPDSN